VYTEVDDIVADITAIYQNTDQTTYQDVTKRTARILHYMQRTGEDLWYDRPWTFAMKSASVTMSSGSAALPTDFGRLSEEGALYDANGQPWLECTSFQDFVVRRAWGGTEKNRRRFIIAGTVQVVDSASTQTFTLVYQKQAPTMETGTGKVTGFPQEFGEAILMGTVVKLQLGENDPRRDWKEDYLKTVMRLRASWRSGRSRLQQMPVTIGGAW
jgi:hypothetical protein